MNEIGAVASRAHRDRVSVGGHSEVQGVNGREVELVGRVRHVVETPLGKLGRRAGVAEIEPPQPRLEVLAPVSDLVELVLHRGRELVVDQVGEVGLEQVHDRECPKGRHQGLALLPDVPAALDRLHHRGVGRRPADSQVFEFLNQRGFGETVRRLGVVRLRLRARHRDQPALF